PFMYMSATCPEVDPNNEDKSNEFIRGKRKVCSIEEGGEFVGLL
ncbi:hypothetical protein Tco_0035046, partial [Tanacetum coccineum]